MWRCHHSILRVSSGLLLSVLGPEIYKHGTVLFVKLNFSSLIIICSSVPLLQRLWVSMWSEHVWSSPLSGSRTQGPIVVPPATVPGQQAAPLPCSWLVGLMWCVANFGPIMFRLICSPQLGVRPWQFWQFCFCLGTKCDTLISWIS